MKLYPFDRFTSRYGDFIATVLKVRPEDNQLEVRLDSPTAGQWYENNWNLAHTYVGFDRGDYQHLKEKADPVGYEERIGGKKVYFLIWPGYAEVRTDCSHWHEPLLVRMTDEQAKELLTGRERLIQDILPDHSREVREVLVSGHTPLEWEAIFNDEFKLPGEMTSEELEAFLPRLEAWGYETDETVCSLKSTHVEADER